MMMVRDALSEEHECSSWQSLSNIFVRFCGNPMKALQRPCLLYCKCGVPCSILSLSNGLFLYQKSLTEHISTRFIT